MNDSVLTRADLEALGITPGKLFGVIFKATRDMSRDDAIATAQSIRNGTWKPPERQSIKLIAGSTWDWFINHPCFSFSRTEIRRMIEQGAIRLNWSNDWSADEPMPSVITELTIFPSGDRRTLLWCVNCSSTCPHSSELSEDIAKEEQRKNERKLARKELQNIT